MAVELGIHNPRQLKRLHNSYRLMKGIEWHRSGRPDINESLLNQWMASMGMLFWLEQLYAMDDSQRKIAEQEIKDARKKDYAVLRQLMSDKRGKAFVEEYERLKKDIKPLMLPFTDKEDVEILEPDGSAK